MNRRRNFRFLCSTYPRSRALPNTVKHVVAKLVKSFGCLGDAAESLDDFRYTTAGARGRVAIPPAPQLRFELG